jgi:hypothetical protein
MMLAGYDVGMVNAQLNDPLEEISSLYISSTLEIFFKVVNKYYKTSNLYLHECNSDKVPCG